MIGSIAMFSVWSGSRSGSSLMCCRPGSLILLGVSKLFRTFCRNLAVTLSHYFGSYINGTGFSFSALSLYC